MTKKMFYYMPEQNYFVSYDAIVNRNLNMFMHEADRNETSFFRYLITLQYLYLSLLVEVRNI